MINLRHDLFGLMDQPFGPQNGLLRGLDRLLGINKTLRAFGILEPGRLGRLEFIYPMGVLLGSYPHSPYLERGKRK